MTAKKADKWSAAERARVEKIKMSIMGVVLGHQGEARQGDFVAITEWAEAQGYEVEDLDDGAGMRICASLGALGTLRVGLIPPTRR
jgi:hypothetical protein